jgi:hemerythrin-like domain-containing protein
MFHAATRAIRGRHPTPSAFLRSMLLLLAEHRRRGTLPDFAALRAMLFYVAELTEKRELQRESELFPRLRSSALLDRLDDDHAYGDRKIREVEHAMLCFEMLGEPRREAFEHALEGYVDFHLAHMAMEEREILPLAERVAAEEDWVDLDDAFRAHRDATHRAGSGSQ